jgi:hypothetical protein
VTVLGIDKFDPENRSVIRASSGLIRVHWWLKKLRYHLQSFALHLQIVAIISSCKIEGFIKAAFINSCADLHLRREIAAGFDCLFQIYCMLFKVGSYHCNTSQTAVM